MTLFRDRKICKLLSNVDKNDQEGYNNNITEENIFGGTKSNSVDRYSLEDEKNKLSQNESISSCMTQVSIKQRNQSESQSDSDVNMGNESEKAKSEDETIDNPETKLVEIDENGIKKIQTSKLIIFDYDDTILPTYSLTLLQKPRFTTKLSDEVIQDLEKLSDAVLDNLNTALKVGIIVIVTNASYEWLSQSVEKYIPKVGEFLVKHKIRIISARDRFGNSLLAQKHWKYFIFIDLIEEQFIRQLKSGEPFSVISIGDGSEEREACMKLVGIFKNQGWTFKNLKFLNQPSYNCLTLQHLLLQKSFKNFIEIESSADLCIQFDKVNH